jgi:hypothetical protein
MNDAATLSHHTIRARRALQARNFFMADMKSCDFADLRSVVAVHRSRLSQALAH